VSALLRAGAADKVVMQRVILVSGFRTLDPHYAPVPGTRLEGHRDDTGIQWKR
jgi:hypothetical protein